MLPGQERATEIMEEKQGYKMKKMEVVAGGRKNRNDFFFPEFLPFLASFH